MRKAIGAAMLAALVLSVGAAASRHAASFNLVANLKARNEVPKPAGVPASAVGLFTAKAAEQSNGGVKITWRLTFSHLTGAATASHIHLAKVGVSGPVAVPLVASEPVDPRPHRRRERDPEEEQREDHAELPERERDGDDRDADERRDERAAGCIWHFAGLFAPGDAQQTRTKPSLAEPLPRAGRRA